MMNIKRKLRHSYRVPKNKLELRLAKERRRSDAARAVADAESKASIDPDFWKRQLGLLLHGHNGLVDSTNSNFQALGLAIENLDVRFGAMELVIADCLRGELSLIGDERRQIDWAEYQHRYIDNLRAKSDANLPDRLYTPPGPADEAPVVFGG